MAKILVVDDSAMSRRILRRMLEPVGHEIIEADNGLAALERYMIESPDLVLLDLTMRGMHGLDVLSKLREMDAHAQIIVATADIQRSSRELVADRGAIGFISKPFILDEVLHAVTVGLTGGTS